MSCACEGCGADRIAYNSCRNRHCPKCQAGAARRWLQARQADLLPVEYYHVVFTLPAPIADIAYQNKAVVYGLLFDVAAETLLHHRRRSRSTWVQASAPPGAAHLGLGADASPARARDRPGGGLAPDGERWVACKPGFFLSVRVLSRLFRRRFLEELQSVHRAAAAVLRRARRAWPTPASSPAGSHRFASASGSSMPSARSPDPRRCWRYLSRYTHRVAIANSGSSPWTSTA
jgi:hypothetical protein